MQYRLNVNAPLLADATQQATELSRFLRFGKQFAVRFVVVAPPYKRERQTLCLIDVPDRFAEQAERVFSILAGQTEVLTKIQGLVRRKEWATHQLLLPQSDATPLDGTLLAGCQSACLEVFYTPERCWAELAYCADDGMLAQRITTARWQMAGKPSALRRLAGGKSKLLPTLTPVPAADAVPAATEAPTPAASPAPERHAQRTEAISVMPAATHAVEDLPLAKAGEAGLPLGVTLDGAQAALTLRAQRLILEAPVEQQRAALAVLMRRALSEGLGVLAVVPRQVAMHPLLSDYTARLRQLDGANLWQSAAIRWSHLPKEQLQTALATAGITAPIPEPVPTPFGALLHAVGAHADCTPALLGLTAHPGDDLRGVLGAGGGVVLIDDGSRATPLLARLLLAHTAYPELPERPLLVLAPTHLLGADAVMAKAIHVAYRRPDAATHPLAGHLTLTADEDGWQVTAPSTAGSVRLLADLTASPQALSTQDYDGILDGLRVGDTPAAAAQSPAAPVMPLPTATDSLTQGDSGNDWWDGAPAVFTVDDRATPASAVAQSIASTGDAFDWALTSDPTALLLTPNAPQQPLEHDAAVEQDAEESEADASLTEMLPEEDMLGNTLQHVDLFALDIIRETHVFPDARADEDAADVFAWPEADDGVLTDEPQDFDLFTLTIQGETEVSPDAQADTDAADVFGLPKADDVMLADVPNEDATDMFALSNESLGLDLPVLDLVADEVLGPDLFAPDTGGETHVSPATNTPISTKRRRVLVPTRRRAAPQSSREVAEADAALSDETLRTSIAAPQLGATEVLSDADATTDLVWGSAWADVLDAPQEDDAVPFAWTADEASDEDAAVTLWTGDDDAALAPNDALLGNIIPDVREDLPPAATAPAQLALLPVVVDGTAREHDDEASALSPVVATDMWLGEDDLLGDDGRNAEAESELAEILTPPAREVLTLVAPAELPVPVMLPPPARPPTPMPVGAADWDAADAVRAWRAGTPLMTLVTRYRQAHPDCDMARARQIVRALVQPASTTVSTPTPPITHLPQQNAADVNEDDSQATAIWLAWQADTPLDQMLVDLCGRKRGPDADATRDRIYAVVVPRIVQAERAEAVVRALANAGSIPTELRAAESRVLQRITRAATPPMGSLAATARQRLLTVMQAVQVVT